jgi:hypothetical protein
MLHSHDRQIVNNSAANKILSVDKSASSISLQPENTHRPATNIQRKRSDNPFNQSFGRVPVRFRSTNEFSFVDAQRAAFLSATFAISQLPRFYRQIVRLSYAPANTANCFSGNLNFLAEPCRNVAASFKGRNAISLQEMGSVSPGKRMAFRAR